MADRGVRGTDVNRQTWDVWTLFDPSVPNAAAAQEVLARCVQEGLDEICRITARAGVRLSKAQPGGLGDQSLPGYAGANVLSQIEALFLQMQQAERPGVGGGVIWTYRDITPQTVLPHQEIRTVREVLHWGWGTCIDWAIVLTSLLRAVCLDPFLLVVTRCIRDVGGKLVRDEEGRPLEEPHALVACPLEERPQMASADPILTGAEFQEEIERRGQRWAAVEATCIPRDANGQLLTYLQATESAIRHRLPAEIAEWVDPPIDAPSCGGLSDCHVLFAVDLHAARDAGIASIRPLAPRYSPLPRVPSPAIERPELGSVIEWWRQEHAPSVMSVVGGAGRGKSGLLASFLCALPGITLGTKEIAKRDELRRQDALFFWDFEDNPHVRACASALHAYLSEDVVAGERYTFDDVGDLLVKEWCGDSVLIVLDGLEWLRDADGQLPAEGGLGKFLEACCLDAISARVLLAGRHEAAELKKHTGRVERVDLQQFPDPAAKELLVALGVKPDADRLRKIIDECGGLVLLLRLMGKALAGAEPTEWAGLIRELDPLDPYRHVLSRYYLPKARQRPGCLQLVEVLSLLENLSPTTALLNGIMAKLPGKGKRVIERLRFLVDELPLVEEISGQGESSFSLHAEERRFFASRMRGGREVRTRRQIAEHLIESAEAAWPLASREQLLGAYEAVRQLALAGKQGAANHVYRRLLSGVAAEKKREGPYDHLSRLNLLSLGRDAVNAVLAGRTGWLSLWHGLRPWERARLFNDRGGFERELGLLDESETSYRMAFLEASRWTTWFWRASSSAQEELRVNRSFALRNPPRTLIFRGHLREALAGVEEAKQHEARAGDSEGLQIAWCLEARARGGLGQVERSLALYQQAREMESADPARLTADELEKRVFTKSYSVSWAHLLARSGHPEDAAEIVRETKDALAGRGLSDYAILQCDLLQVHLDRLADAGVAWFERLRRIRQAADTAPRNDVVIWCDLSIARFALAELALRGAGSATRNELAARCIDSVDAGLRLAEGYGYALHWIDLQVARGCLHLAEADHAEARATKEKHIREAHTAARLALYGKPLVDESDPRKDSPTTPIHTLRIVGAANPACRYRWGMVNAMRLLVDCHKDGCEAPPVPAGRNLKYFERLESRLRKRLQPDPARIPVTLR